MEKYHTEIQTIEHNEREQEEVKLKYIKQNFDVNEVLKFECASEIV